MAAAVKAAAVALLAAVGCASIAAPAPMPTGEPGFPPMAVWTAETAGVHEDFWFTHPGADGLLYFGNGFGVVSFDGQRWQLIPTPNQSRVRRIATDTNGQLVIATIDDLMRIEPGPNGDPKMVSLLAKVPEDQRRFGDPLGLAVTPAGYYVAGTRALMFFGRDGTTVRAFTPRAQQIERVGQRVYVHRGADGIGYFDDASPLDLKPLPGGERTKGSGVGFIIGMSDGSLLVSPRREGVLLRWRDGEWSVFRTEADPLIRSVAALAACELPDGSIVIGTEEGAVRVSREGRVITRWVEKDGLPGTAVVHAALDRAGGLWFSVPGGVVRVAWDSPLTIYDMRHDLPPVNDLARHGDRLLVATNNDLRVRVEGARGANAFAVVEGNLKYQTFGVTAASGEVFITQPDGVFRVDHPKGDPLKWKRERLVDAPFGYRVVPDRRDPDRMFAVTVRGVSVLRREGGKWSASAPMEGVGAGDPRSLVQEASGAIWVGSSTGRAWRVEPKDAAWKAWVVRSFGAADGLPPGNVSVFAFQGGVSLATSKGPLVLAPSGRFEPDARLASLALDGEWFAAQEASNGDLWTRVTRRTGYARKTANGFVADPAILSPLPPEPAYAYVEDNGATWVALSKTLVRMAGTAARPAPSVEPRLRAIRGSAGEVLATGAKVEGASLPASASDLRLEFAWPEFALGSAARFRSKLEGHDADFTPWTREANRDLGGLWGGRYTLRLEAMDAYGRMYAAKPLAFALAPPWYRTPFAWFAWALAVLGSIALVAWGFARWRTARLLRAQAELERVVDERTVQVRNQADRLQALDAAKSRFFAGVTHEFRTPLTLILEPLRELKEGAWGRMPGRASSALEHAERNAQRVLGLVNQLLDLQAAEAGTLKLAPRVADLAAFARAIAAQFDGLATRSGLTLEVDAPGPAMCAFDGAHMESVVVNLLGNAIKFTPRGGHITLRVARAEDRVTLTVEDNGPGIDPAALPHIFERFYRAPSREVRAHGTGIGLAVVKEVVERHGGTVIALSEPGRGSRFEVRLPAAAASATAEEAAGDAAGDGTGDAAPGFATAHALAEFGDTQGPAGPLGESDATTVLVVDDNVELRAFIAQRLAARYRVLQASDGVEALAVAREHLPDVVVTDVNMPNMDGIELCRQLRADTATSAIPIVLLASTATGDARNEAFSIGADEFVYKPFNTAELLARIAGLIASRRQLRAALVEAARRAPAEDGPSLPPLVQKVRDAVLANLGDSDFGVGELAESLGMERTTLFKHLKALDQPAPVKLMRDIRLDAAARMLREAAGQVTEVAYACGYESLSHFSTAFAEKFGVRPSEYAQRARARSPG
ncbi:hypothetical protein BWI17_13170 [Betaproteobacteria bacterium GR16-43]|nr:hypothetical protein BWI17_13170 [Betaproteobacteria bacterium GR16-43]